MTSHVNVRPARASRSTSLLQDMAGTQLSMMASAVSLDMAKMHTAMLMCVLARARNDQALEAMGFSVWWTDRNFD